MCRSLWRYCVTRKELLAVVNFTQHFRSYLLGRKFRLCTDHGSLTWLANFKQPEGQLARWLERLQEFHFRIVHRKRHENADSLSRQPCTQCGRDSHEDTPGTAIPVSAQSAISESVLTERSNQDLRKLQLEDGPIRLLLQAVEKGEKPDVGNVRRQGPEAQRLLQLWGRLIADGGLLKRMYEDVHGSQSWQQLVVPHVLREEIMQELHSGALEGHLGVDKTVAKIKERFYWPAVHVPTVQQGSQHLSGIVDHYKPSKQATHYKLLQWTSLDHLLKVTPETPTFSWLVTTSPNGWRHTLFQIRKR